MLKNLVPLAAICIGLAACDSTGGGPALANSAGTMAVSFQWCSPSPEFKVSRIPPGTKTLRFHMVDHNSSGYMHGGGEVPFTVGGSITVPCGGFKSSTYDPPQPPAGTVHEYEWTVTALDASGSTLATGGAVRKYPER